jgi:WD40 repeat protein
MKPIKHQNYLLIIWAIQIISCNPSEFSSSIDLSKNQIVSVWDIYSEINAIKLETTEYSLISEIKKIEYHQSNYYLLDERSQQIFCFDESGRSVFTINAQGKGPGEYHYITDIAIDHKNNQLLVLDPVVQRVHFYDLDGAFLSSHYINTEKVLGLNRVYPMGDSLLLLASITYEALQIYCLKDEKLIFSDFVYDVPSTLHAFSPRDNVYFFDDRIYFLVPLSREIVDVSKIQPELYFTWCFGPNNNTEEQIDRLLKDINKKMEIPEYILLPWQAVGKNKILNHHILKSFENDRFRIAAVEFNNDYKFVVVDKNDNQTLVFGSFKEGVRLPYEHMQSDRAIAFYKPEFGPRELSIIEREGWQDYFFGRNNLLYLPEILHEGCREIIKNHNPMTDNPYLVVYKFKE